MTPTDPPATPVDTKAAERRPLDYASFDALRADLDAIELAHRSGSLRATGNWTPAQAFCHVGRFMRYAIDGFPSRAPFFVRWVASALYKKKAVTPGEPMPAGIKLPKQAAFMLPPDDPDFDASLAEIRSVLERLDAGERFTQDSPVFGRFTHEQWCTVQLKHASLHFSFLHPGGASS